MKPKKRYGPPEPRAKPAPTSVRAARTAAILRAPAIVEMPPRPWRLERRPDGRVVIRDARGHVVSFFASNVINRVIALVNAADAVAWPERGS